MQYDRVLNLWQLNIYNPMDRRIKSYHPCRIQRGEGTGGNCRPHHSLDLLVS